MMKRILVFILTLTMLLSLGTFAISADVNDTVIYQQNFETFEDSTDSNAILQTLGWKPQFISDFTTATVPYKDATSTFQITEKKLKVTNTIDSYYVMLDEAAMEPYKTSNLSVQYDVMYYSAINSTRYIVIVTNYTGQRYNSFHLRMNGTGNSQLHFDDNKWFTYDTKGSNLYAAGLDDAASGQSILNKLTGSTYIADAYSIMDMNLTIKYVIDWSKSGPDCYVRNNWADNPQFIHVSTASGYKDAEGNPAATDALPKFNRTDLPGNAICLKPGGDIVGYIDNIVIWAGTGESPVTEPDRPKPETTVPPDTTKAPTTTAKTTTKAVTTAAPTPSTTAKPTTDKPTKKSCGKSGVIMAAAQAVVVIGSSVVFAAVKKKF